jgi:hypothetical protein
MKTRKPGRRAPSTARRVKSSTRNATSSSSEMLLRAEVNVMREIVVILVQALTDLFECLPKDLYADEKVTRVEATLVGVRRALAERRQEWEAPDETARTRNGRPLKMN